MITTTLWIKTKLLSPAYWFIEKMTCEQWPPVSRYHFLFFLMVAFVDRFNCIQIDQKALKMALVIYRLLVLKIIFLACFIFKITFFPNMSSTILKWCDSLGKGLLQNVHTLLLNSTDTQNWFVMWMFVQTMSSTLRLNIWMTCFGWVISNDTLILWALSKDGSSFLYFFL